MKILLVSDYGTPTGGAEIQFLGMRERLRARGHDVRFFASAAQPTAVPNAADYTCFGTTSRLRGLLQTANPWAAQQLRTVLETFQPDVVHVKIFLTQLSPLILPLLRNVPALYHVVWYRPVCPTGTKLLPNGAACTQQPGAVCLRHGCVPLQDWAPLMLQMRLWRRWRDSFKLIVANSAATRAHLLAAGIGPVEVIWNGVRPRPLRPALPDLPLVVFAGRLVPEKGVDLLLRAFQLVARELPAARLLLIGEGPEQAALHKQAGALGLAERVEMTGRLPREELEARCGAAWVQAVPSRWDEPFGIVAAEAAMRGTAVVASAGGGLAEIVQDGETGLLVPPGDEQALAAALLRLLRNREQAEAFGRAGRTRALQHFNEDLVAEAFLERYRRISSGELGRPTPPRDPVEATST
ncbi:MAG: glycosyltransferase family 4 protein [Oscillochloris sp.]|nr:glycosyltransferase family 4 protein [Oscillochloris sp.]